MVPPKKPGDKAGNVILHNFHCTKNCETRLPATCGWVRIRFSSSVLFIALEILLSRKRSPCHSSTFGLLNRVTMIPINQTLTKLCFEFIRKLRFPPNTNKILAATLANSFIILYQLFAPKSFERNPV